MAHFAAILLFSFVELLVVLAILVILAAFVIPSVISAREKAEAAAKCITIAKAIANSIDECRNYVKKRLNGYAGTDDATLRQMLDELNKKLKAFLKDCIINNNALSNFSVDKINSAIGELSKYLPKTSGATNTTAKETIHELTVLKHKLPE